MRSRRTQSSWVVGCRALVMVTCLVALPLAAVTGTTGPGLVVPLLDACLNLLQGPAADRQQTGSRPPAPPNPALAAAPIDRPGRSGRKRAPGLTDPGRVAVPSRPGSHQQPEQGRRAASQATSVSSEAMADNCPTQPEPNAGRQAPAKLANRLTAPEQRLRQLGATYYLLEKWGVEAAVYRFQCRVAIAGDADHVRYFEATAQQPAVAVHTVLRQVEAWRSAGGQP